VGLLRAAPAVEGGLVTRTIAPKEFLRIVDAATQAILVRGLDGAIRFWNHGAQSIYGWTAEEALGKAAHELFQTRFPEPLDAINGRLLRDGEWTGELIHRRRDGPLVVVEAHWTLIRDEAGRPQAVIEVGTDVTPRIRVKETLHASEERFRLLVDSIQDYAIYLMDLEGRVSSWNAGAERITGFRATEIVGQDYARFFAPEDVAANKPATELETARREGRFAGEGWRIRKDGTRFWAGVVLTAARDGAGRLIGFAKVTRDLTERKAAEERQEALVRDLQRSNKDLEQFAFFASHDLQEPLRKISIYGEFLEGFAPKIDPEAARLVGSMLSATRRMREMISKILEYSRLGREERALEPVDLTVAVGQALADLDSAIKKAGAEIAVDKLPVVKASPSDIGRLLENLIGNAVKFHKASSPKVRVFAERAGAEWKIGVRDEGIGIPAEYVREIFEPFRRLHHRGEFEGSGLGLAICKRIVELHRGRIWVESEAGKGSTFFFTLPAAD
jgi:PAS domain S-box-containing protein